MTDKKIRVLLIDDEPETVDMVKTFLELFEFDVEGQLTGGDGMQSAISNQPQVIVLDLMLPDADGFQICRLLRHHKMTRHIPIIILSARVSKDDEAKGLYAGATIYMRKPVDLNRLVEEMRRVVPTGHVPPPGYSETSKPTESTKPITDTENGSSPVQRPAPSKPALSARKDTVHIPGMYIPRGEDSGKDE
jgi:DNA-binding response OmpR family regulator